METFSKDIMKYKTLEPIKFLEVIKNYCTNDCSLSYAAIGWDDGEYFKGENRFDMDDISKKIDFKSFVKPKRISCRNLEDKLKLYFKTPYITSKDKNYIFNYDLHIWICDKYLIYNFHHHFFYEKKLNFIERIFKVGKQAEWLK